MKIIILKKNSHFSTNLSQIHVTIRPDHGETAPHIRVLSHQGLLQGSPIHLIRAAEALHQEPTAVQLNHIF